MKNTLTLQLLICSFLFWLPDTFPKEPQGIEKINYSSIPKTITLIDLKFNTPNNNFLNFNDLELPIKVVLDAKSPKALAPSFQNNIDCKLIAELIDGQPVISYEYDYQDRLVVKNYIQQNYKEVYTYNIENFLIKVTNNSENPFTINFEYQNNRLSSKTIIHHYISNPQYFTYVYNANGELTKITEKLLTETVTEFNNGKVIKITNAFIKYDLNDLGLVIKAKSLVGPQTENLYKYDKNDMLILKETYSSPGVKIMYSEYKNSTIKRLNLGDEFVESYLGMPKFKNPFGDKSYHISSTTNYSINYQTKKLEKSFQTENSLTIDATGKLTYLQSIVEANSPLKSFHYLDCN